MISANSAVSKYGKVAEDLNVKQMNTAIEEFSKTANQLNSVVSGIQKGEGSLGKLTKDEELYNNLTKTTSSLNQLVEDMKANPKRYVNISVFGKNNKD